MGQSNSRSAPAEGSGWRRKAHFVPLAPGAPLPGPCAALLVVCFRADGCLLMLQAAAPPAAWDLPHGPLPPGERDPARAAGPLVSSLSGVHMVPPPTLYGSIQGGVAMLPAAHTACLYGEVGHIGPLPGNSWAVHRAFLHPPDAFHRLPGDDWGRVRRACLEAAVEAAAARRDFWLLQPLDAISRADLDDVLE